MMIDHHVPEDRQADDPDDDLEGAWGIMGDHGGLYGDHHPHDPGSAPHQLALTFGKHVVGKADRERLGAVDP